MVPDLCCFCCKQRDLLFVRITPNTFSMTCLPLSSLIEGYHLQRIRVRTSRLWHHRGGLETGGVKDIRMVLVDEQVRNNSLSITSIKTHAFCIHVTFRSYFLFFIP